MTRVDGSEDAGLGIVRLNIANGETERITPAEGVYLRPNVSPSGEAIVVEQRQAVP